MPLLSDLHEERGRLGVHAEHKPFIDAQHGTSQTVRAGVTVTASVTVTVTAAGVQRTINICLFSIKLPILVKICPTVIEILTFNKWS